MTSAASDLVFDVTAETFQSAVADRSAGTPVLLDFWAAWCGPCKTLGPILEKLVVEYDGAFLLGKVDSDREAELSQAFQVQSIPFCILIEKGRPLDAFAGALSEDEVRAMLAKNGIAPPATADGTDSEQAPDAPASRLQAARAAAIAGDVAAARAALADFPEEDPLHGDRDHLDQGLAFLEADLPTGSNSGPADRLSAAELLGQARGHFLSNRYEEALQAIVASAREDRSYGEGLARRAMLLCQCTLQDTDLVDEYRRKLATLLY